MLTSILLSGIFYFGGREGDHEVITGLNFTQKSHDFQPGHFLNIIANIWWLYRMGGDVWRN